MKKYLIILLFIFFFPNYVSGEALSKRLSGKILLSVEENGEAWYVNPQNNLRYYLGSPDDAFKVMQELGLGISDHDLNRIKKSNEEADSEYYFSKKLAGRIVLQVEQNGEAWYVNPDNLNKYYLGSPEDAYRVMRQLGLGISKSNLFQIEKVGEYELIDSYSNFQRRKVAVDDRYYYTDVLEIDLRDNKMEILTVSAENKNCVQNCVAKSLADYVKDTNSFAGINGTYFCSSRDCVQNYFYFPVYNTIENSFINEEKMQWWTTGPLMVFDTTNNFYYFKDNRNFLSVSNFEKTYNVKIQAAIGNIPRLVEGGKNIAVSWDMDFKQKNIKTTRNSIGFNNGKILLVSAHSASVMDLANIMVELGAEYALNLDGGGSSAIYYKKGYLFGPGRNIPNAILFREKSNVKK